MRQGKWIALLVGLQVLNAVPVQAETANPPAIYVNDEQAPLAKQPLIISGRTYVSVLDLAQLFDGATKEVNGKLSLRIGKDTFTTEQKERVPGDYLPLRTVAETAGFTVKWDQQTRSVFVSEGEKAIQSFESFTLVEEASLSDEEKAFVSKNKQTKGVHQLGNLYVVALGPSPNPGYGIQLEKSVQSWEQLFVHVRLTKPEPGMMYPQVITYPYLVGRVDLPPYTTIQFLDAETGSKLF